MLTLGVYAVVSEEGYVCFAVIFALRIVRCFFKETIMSWDGGVLSGVASAFVSGGIALLGTSSWFYGAIVIGIGVIGFLFSYWINLVSKRIEYDKNMIANAIRSGNVDFNKLGRNLDLIKESYQYESISCLDYFVTEFKNPGRMFSNKKTAKLYDEMSSAYEPLSLYIGQKFSGGRLSPELNSDLVNIPAEREGMYSEDVKGLKEVYYPFRESYDKFIDHLHKLGYPFE